MGNGEWGMGNGEREIVVSGNVLKNKLEFAPYGKETRTVVSERWKVRIFICQFFPSFWNH